MKLADLFKMWINAVDYCEIRITYADLKNREEGKINLKEKIYYTKDYETIYKMFDAIAEDYDKNYYVNNFYHTKEYIHIGICQNIPYWLS